MSILLTTADPRVQTILNGRASAQIRSAATLEQRLRPFQIGLAAYGGRGMASPALFALLLTRIDADFAGRAYAA